MLKGIMYEFQSVKKQKCNVYYKKPEKELKKIPNIFKEKIIILALTIFHFNHFVIGIF